LGDKKIYFRNKKKNCLFLEKTKDLRRSRSASTCTWTTSTSTLRTGSKLFSSRKFLPNPVFFPFFRLQPTHTCWEKMYTGSFLDQFRLQPAEVETQNTKKKTDKIWGRKKFDFSRLKTNFSKIVEISRLKSNFAQKVDFSRLKSNLRRKVGSNRLCTGSQKTCNLTSEIQ